MKPTITAVILAGGLARRMNGLDKGLQLLQGKPLFQHILQRLIPQAEQILINANRSQALYQQSGFEVFSDDQISQIPEYSGPLSGMLAGLKQAKYDWVLFIPCDSPFFPTNLADKLYQSLFHQHTQQPLAKAAYVTVRNKAHPTFCLLQRDLILPLTIYLQQGQRRVLQFMQQQHALAVNFDQESAAFTNINTLAELAKLNQTEK